MMLIGSQALSIILTGKILPDPKADFDILIEKSKLDVFLAFHKKESYTILKKTPNSMVVKDDLDNGKIYDFLFVEPNSTDYQVINSMPKCRIHCRFLLGDVNVVNPEMLKLIYLSSYKVLKKEKYEHHAIALRDFITENNNQFFNQRNAEIKKRKEENFFHKYPGLSEHIKHDDIHDIIADKLGLKEPTYKKVISDPTKGTEAAWNNLLLSQKIMERVEETIVIYLERSWIPTCIEQKQIVPVFNMKAINKAISHVNEHGLRDQGKYLTIFSQNLYATIALQVSNFLEEADLQELKDMVQDIIDKKRESYYTGEQLEKIRHT